MAADRVGAPDEAVHVEDSITLGEVVTIGPLFPPELASRRVDRFEPTWAASKWFFAVVSSSWSLSRILSERRPIVFFVLSGRLQLGDQTIG